MYTRLLKQQREQISLAGQNNELAKMKYQVVQGELASLDNAKKAILLQNAALIDQKNIEEKLQHSETVWLIVMLLRVTGGILISSVLAWVAKPVTV
jgi:phage-related minor tail protein